MEAENRCIGFGVRWVTIGLEAAVVVIGALKEGLELAALEWDCAVVIAVFDEDTLFLEVGNTERFARQRCEQCGIRGEPLGEGMNTVRNSQGQTHRPHFVPL